MTMPVTLSAAELERARRTFASDQSRAARHERTETAAVAVARVMVALFLLAGLWSVLAVLGLLPVAGWSPLG